MLRALQVSLFRMRIPTKGMGIVQRSTILPDRVNQVRFYSEKSELTLWEQSLDEAQQERIRFIRNELELHGVEDREVPKPDELSRSDFELILPMSRTRRIKYYRYLYKQRLSDSGDAMKARIRNAVRLEKKEDNNYSDAVKTEHIQYGLGKGALIPKIYGRTVDKWRNLRSMWRLTQNESKLIFDCSFSTNMNDRENHEAAKQLSYCFAANRAHLTPFQLHFCGLNPESSISQKIHRTNPMLGRKALPLKLHQEQAHEVFPVDNLVILTPDSPNILHKFNPDDNYVISAIVDRGDQLPLTQAKAKQFNLRTARLPIEQYRRCRVNKVLTLDQMLQVMLEIKFSGDWNRAFRFVAARKFY